MPATSTDLAKTPSDFSCDTNALMLSTGPEIVQLVTLLRQAISMSCGSLSLIWPCPSPKKNVQIKNKLKRL